MRKIIAFLLVLLMIVGLAACGRRGQKPADPTPVPTPEAVTPADEQNGTPSGETPAPSESPAETPEIPEPAPAPVPDEPPEESPAEDPAEPKEEIPSEPEAGEDPEASVPVPDEDGWYYDLENVVAYLMAYGKLPSNYITKRQAEDLGWSGGSVQRYREGAAIGGGRFGNYEGLLPEGKYTECDIDTDGASSRGAKRLVFSSDGHYYYTDDHYETFAEVTFVDGRMVLDYDY